ncbi:hypothetical protein SDC9_155671 [bioreactor metagenome]|uniref:Uncharacterized protein n=1 Tax=bioreactor metagenome TaxID=1076179 RepID=A0A645F4N5_9ZZZZ
MGEHPKIVIAKPFGAGIEGVKHLLAGHGRARNEVGQIDFLPLLKISNAVNLELLRFLPKRNGGPNLYDGIRFIVAVLLHIVIPKLCVYLTACIAQNEIQIIASLHIAFLRYLAHNAKAFHLV